MRKSAIQQLGILGAVLALGACDLDVVNVQQPDRDRAIGEPTDLQALIGGGFNVFFNTVHGINYDVAVSNHGHVVNMFPNLGAEMTGIPASGGSETVVEPRPPLTNTPSVSVDGPRGHRMLWAGMSVLASNMHDGLRTLNESNVTILEGERDVTPRARAFAKFMQGLAWGYMSMAFDQAIIVPETEPLREDALQQGRERLTPAAEVRTAALAAIAEARDLARQNGVTFPSAGASLLFFATPEPMGTDEFVRLANTMSARILVLSARNPEERTQVDWARVLELTANGIEKDFEVMLAPGYRSSELYQRMEDNSPGCANCFRWNNRLIGHADVSGAYQRWISLDVDLRDRFDIVTPDRRITGATPQSDGAYTRYWAHDNGFAEGRGLYFRSGYQWARHFFRGFRSNSGTAILASADENTLLRAEALLRTGDLDGAAALINVTRTRRHTLPDGIAYDGLPPVTRDGVPQGAACVPRTDAGACGDLVTALWYERMIELAGLDAFRGYADARAFGLLPDYTFTLAPVPGNELEVLELPVYTFGGQGGQWSAVYRPATIADL